MEIIVALVVIGLVGYWLYSSNKKSATPEVAPYKVETPVPAVDVAPQPVVVEGAGAVEAPAAKPAKAKKAPAAKKPAAKPAAKKPAAKKAPAKKKPSA